MVGCAVYLLIGLIFMVLTLTVFYEIPQLNVGSVFLLKSDEYMTSNASGGGIYDSEKARIQGGGHHASLGGVLPASLGSSTASAAPFGAYGILITAFTIPTDNFHKQFISLIGASYGATEEEVGRSSRQVVRVKSRREDDSPSPDDLTPVHARP